MRIAVLITVFNRLEKTVRCLESLQQTALPYLGDALALKVFLTDDGSTDSTAELLSSRSWTFPMEILPADGTLFWNGGMINSWKAALAQGGFDGYLWLNNDTVVLPDFWQDLMQADEYALDKWGRRGVYVGSTRDHATGAFTYGGFVYTNKLTLKDKFVVPDGMHFQECEAGHGNITYVSASVVDKMGIFCEKYHHGGSDHDYTYLAHKAGFPVLVLPHWSGECENDHLPDGGRADFFALSLQERLRRLNLHNTLLFNRRCFPWRCPIIAVSGWFKALMPRLYYWLYLRFRGVRISPLEFKRS